MIRCLDFNADLGEGGDDQSLMPWLSSASIACGFHAGDPARMRDTVALCLQHGVAIGAQGSDRVREHAESRLEGCEVGELRADMDGDAAGFDAR